MSEKVITIGGSDVSTILGFNPYSDVMELWEIKTGKKPPKEFTNKMKVGSYFEEAIAKLFEDENGFKLIKNDYKTDKFCHPVKNYFVGVMDYISEENKTIVEIKYTNVDYDSMLPSYIAQLEYYLWLANEKWPGKFKVGYVACVSKGEYKQVRIDWDNNRKEIYQKLTLPKLEYFYKACVEDFEPKELIKDYIEIKTNAKAMDENDYKLYKDYKAITAQIKKLETEKDMIAKVLKEKYADAEETYYEDPFEGKSVIARVVSYEKENFDAKSLAKEYPDLYGKFLFKQKVSYFKIL